MEQVKKMVIACIVSRKGGVPITEIDNEYQQLVGMKIPYVKYGFLSLEDLIQSISEIMMVDNPDGSIILKARDTKTSHIASLVAGQKTTGNTRKKVANCYRMPPAGQNYMRGASRHCNYENKRSNNYRKMERSTQQSVTQEKMTRHRKQEIEQLHTLHAENFLKHPNKRETTQGIEIHTEKYTSKTSHKENKSHHFKTKQPLKTINHHFQQKNVTDKIQALDDSDEEFDRSQVKVKNRRRISVDDTILVTIVNNYYRSSSNENHSRHRSLLCDSRTEEEEREIEEDEFHRCSNHHYRYSKEFSTVTQKYRMNQSRKGKPVNYYEELYVQKKWTEDPLNDCAENVSGYYIREDSDYTHYKRDVSRKNPGLLIKVKNEYATDRHMYTAI